MLISILLIIPVLTFVYPAGAEETFFNAAAKGDVLFIKNYKGNVNAADKNGMTALMLAAQNGRSETVELLITDKADVNIADNNGYTVLSLTKYPSIINLLKKAGAK